MGAFTDKLRALFGLRKAVSAELFDDLRDLLIEGDFGAHEAYNITETLQDACRKEKIVESDAVRYRLAALLEDMLRASSLRNGASVDAAFATDSDVAYTIILLLGVNGVGKTTTAAKLGARYAAYSDAAAMRRKPVLAAADTFRAAAVDQLMIHGERLGLRVVAHQRGGNPAAVIYDAIEAAAGKGIIIADTAGRMHTKSALVEELKKIDRVVESKAAGANYLKWLVLDATTGRNALAQAAAFKEAVAVNGVILTKFDSGAKGGAVFSLESELKLPVLYVCNGEKYEDITPFNAKTYAKEFAGIP
ncbi:MAG: signal recognition particle-docking protein FtsY [Treponema sp.]|jgi:fused signal recognition particle receptor|nr:signal recognition particle-docking protein FtsY [Treponema sp.]